MTPQPQHPPSRPSVPPTPPSRSSLWIASVVVALAVLAVFLNCLHNSFLWDDEQFVVKNSFLTSARFLPNLLTENIVAGAGLVSNLYRPLQSFTHFMDVRWWGARAWGHHLTNVLLHVAAAVAVFRVMATLVPVWPAVCATLLFALHPLQSEAVAYVSGRGDTLAILWLCLGLLAFRRSLWLSLLCALLGMASKESLALVPLFVLLYEYARGVTPSWKRHLPLWLLSGAYVAARLTVLNFRNTLNFYDGPNVLTEHPLWRVFTYLTTIPKGIWLWWWPLDLHHERSWMVCANVQMVQVWGGAVLVACLIGVAWWCRRRRPLVTVGIAWFFVATLPTSNLLVLINALFYDHWFILPGFGLAIITAQMLAIGWRDRRAWMRGTVRLVTLIQIVTVAVLAWRYNGVWHDPLSLYTHILRWEPQSAKTHNNVGMVYADAGRLTEAMREYRQAIAISDEYPQTHHNLGNAYLQIGDEAHAEEEFRRAVAMQPAFHHAWMQLGVLAFKRRQWQEAAAAFASAMRAYPYAAEAYVGLAQASLGQGRLDEALRTLETGTQRLPQSLPLQAALRDVRAMRERTRAATAR